MRHMSHTCRLLVSRTYICDIHFQYFNFNLKFSFKVFRRRTAAQLVSVGLRERINETNGRLFNEQSARFLLKLNSPYHFIVFDCDYCELLLIL